LWASAVTSPLLGSARCSVSTSPPGPATSSPPWAPSVTFWHSVRPWKPVLTVSLVLRSLPSVGVLGLQRQQLLVRQQLLLLLLPLRLRLLLLLPLRLRLLLLLPLRLLLLLLLLPHQLPHLLLLLQLLLLPHLLLPLLMLQLLRRPHCHPAPWPPPPPWSPPGLHVTWTKA